MSSSKSADPQADGGIPSAFAWSMLWPATLLLFAFFVPGLSQAAEEKKPEKKKEPPRVVVVLPLGVVPGVTNNVKIRGLNLTNATELRFPGIKEPVEFKIKSGGKAEVPKEQDAKKWGDTQLDVELRLPQSTPEGTNVFTVVSPDGESEPHVLVVIPATKLVLEKEPNGSFRQAQPIEFGKIMQGAIGEAKDVDVFRFEGKAGMEILAEVSGSRYGSLLDSILTLYDDHAHIIATTDDTGTGTDAVLRARLPADGKYFLSLIDAQDRGGPACVYHLAMTQK